jgi:hypothetical protein
MVPDPLVTECSESSETISVARQDRWQVYQRLQELDISCSCTSEQPLQTQIQSPTDALQVWSVVQQITAPRQDLVFWLKRCWNVSI